MTKYTMRRLEAQDAPAFLDMACIELGRYTRARRSALLLARYVSPERAQRLRMCHARLLVRAGDDVGVHIMGLYCCGHRLCPLCQRKKARIVAAQACEALAYLHERGSLEGYSPYLVTLTQRSVQRGELGAELDRLLEALRRLRHVRAYQRYVCATARTVEVTRSALAGWHPHVHVIVWLSDAEEARPLRGGTWWRQEWQRLMRLGYVPICDVRPITEESGGVVEVSKYAAKAQTLLEGLTHAGAAVVVPELESALERRKLVLYTGLWREARRALKLADDAEEDDGSELRGPYIEAVLEWAGLTYRLEGPAAVVVEQRKESAHAP